MAGAPVAEQGLNLLPEPVVQCEGPLASAIVHGVYNTELGKVSTGQQVGFVGEIIDPESAHQGLIGVGQTNGCIQQTEIIYLDQFGIPGVLEHFRRVAPVQPGGQEPRAYRYLIRG